MERYLLIDEKILIQMLDEASRWQEKNELKTRSPELLKKERRRIINEIYIDNTADIEKQIM